MMLIGFAASAFSSMTIWEMEMMIVSILFLGGLAIGLVLLGKWGWHTLVG